MLGIVLSSSGSLHEAPLKVCLVRQFVITRSVSLTSTVQGRPFPSAELSSQLVAAKVPNLDGHFLISNLVIFPVLPPSVVRVACISQFIPLPGLVSNISPPVIVSSMSLLTFVPWSFHTAARARAGTASITTAAIEPASNNRLLIFISLPIPFL